MEGSCWVAAYRSEAPTSPGLTEGQQTKLELVQVHGQQPWKGIQFGREVVERAPAEQRQAFAVIS